MISQFDPEGRLRHLITLRGLEREQIIELLDRAEAFLRPAGELPAITPVEGYAEVAELSGVDPKR